MTTPPGDDPFTKPDPQAQQPGGYPPPQPGYGTPPPGYGQPYGQPYPQTGKTNTLAIISLVGAFLCTPVGLVCGIIALNQIKQSGEGGKGLAIAGIAVSAVSFLIGILVFAAAFASDPTGY